MPLEPHSEMDEQSLCAIEVAAATATTPTTTTTAAATTPTTTTTAAADAGDQLRRLAAKIRNDDETRLVVEGFATSVERLRRSAGGPGDTVQKVVNYLLAYSHQLVSGNEAVTAGNAILELSVPRRRDDLLRLTVKVRHCVEGLLDATVSVRKCYADINSYASEAVPDSGCLSDVQNELLEKILWAAEFADAFLGQAIRKGEETLGAIQDFHRGNRVHYFGYRTILHAILLFVAIGIVTANIATKGLQAYESLVITIGFVLYLVLEYTWWPYTTHRITVAQKGIKDQMAVMRNLQTALKNLIPPARDGGPNITAPSTDIGAAVPDGRGPLS